MKTIRVKGKIIRSGDYHITSAMDIDEGLEINSPSTLINLLRIRKKLRESVSRGFTYTFPMAFDPLLETNGFPGTFPLIFE